MAQQRPDTSARLREAPRMLTHEPRLPGILTLSSSQLTTMLQGRYCWEIQCHPCTKALSPPPPGPQLGDTSPLGRADLPGGPAAAFRGLREPRGVGQASSLPAFLRPPGHSGLRAARLRPAPRAPSLSRPPFPAQPQPPADPLSSHRRFPSHSRRPHGLSLTTQSTCPIVSVHVHPLNLHLGLGGSYYHCLPFTDGETEAHSGLTQSPTSEEDGISGILGSDLSWSGFRAPNSRPPLSITQKPGQPPSASPPPSLGLGQPQVPVCGRGGQVVALEGKPEHRMAPLALASAALPETELHRQRFLSGDCTPTASPVGRRTGRRQLFAVPSPTVWSLQQARLPQREGQGRPSWAPAARAAKRYQAGSESPQLKLGGGGQ